MTGDPNRTRFDHLRLRSALVDRVTGLPSLPLLFDELRALLERRRTVGLLHVWAPNLMLAETVYGWQTFDRIAVRQSAELERMRGETLPEDTRLAQLGVHGAEVIAVVPGKPGGGEVDTTFLKQLAREAETRMRALFTAEEFATLVPRLEPRVGFAFLSENPYLRFERLVYRAVEEARSQPERREERLRRSWGEEIRQVIREERIIVHYQPVVDLATLEVIGYEALSRGPAGSGFESPALMFELSREAGVAAELDRLCRRRALASARGIARGRKIFVNVRIDLLADPDWRDGRIEERLARLDLSPDRLVLEIPEPGASSDDAAFERLAADLRRRGFLFALDDIGTGYGGIHSIERLHPDYLKIDTSLVRRIDANLIQQDILGSLVSIGRRIGASVIAEGIESQREMEFLKSSGALYGQGFLFSPPVPVILPGPFAVEREH